MHSQYPNLFSPLKIGTRTVKNRICCAPQSVVGAYDKTGLTDRGFAYYLEKAKGGCGIVTIGETQVLSSFFQTPDPDEIAKFHLLTELMHEHGALASIELGHRGCEDYVFTPGAHVEGPSGGIKEPFGVIIDEISESRMNELADAYVDACQVCLDCGFDMVMIHGGHSWLLAQFLSPLFNHRTDQYGGSLENRARFPLMVLERIRSRVGHDLLIEYRMSADEIIDGGVHIDEMGEFAHMMEGYVDLIHASVGTHIDPKCYTFTSIYHPNGINLPLAKAIKERVSIPVASIGGFNTPEQCEAAIASGGADLIYLGRQMLADPHFAEKAESGEPDEINTCIRCMCCHEAPPPPTFCMCSVNPTGCREYLTAPPPVRHSRRVVVVGGGPGGMTAANRAAALGHQVTLLEQADHLGGALDFAHLDSWKGDLKQFRDNLISRTLRRAIDVRLSTEATPSLLKELAPDAVICAVGAKKATPLIPGLVHAIHATDAYRLTAKQLGRRVVVVGGGLIGCEFAMHCTALGIRPVILEMGQRAAPDGYRMHREWLLQRLEQAAELHLETRCTQITPYSVQAITVDSIPLEFAADTVVFALGMQPRTETVELLHAATEKRFIAVGDCRRVGKVKDAVHEGHFAPALIL